MEKKPHSFCETPEENCTMNYCDDNGCQNRKRELVNQDPSSELTQLKAENEQLKQTLSDAMELNRMQREHANKMYELIKEFKIPLITNPYQR
jgi:hypothetical protein